MTEDEKKAQQELHEAVEGCLRKSGRGDDGILTGWVLVFEQHGIDGNEQAGHFYGPSEMTTWRALGLIEWTRRFCLVPGTEENDGNEGA